MPKLSGYSPPRPGAIGNRAISTLGGPFGRGVQFMMKYSQPTFHEQRFQTQQHKAIDRLLHRFGGYTQTVAKRSLGRPKKFKAKDPGKVWWNGKEYRSWRYSDPGEKPKIHSKAIPANIRFEVDLRTRNVIIGPTPKANRILSILEYGGPETLLVNYKRSKSGRLIMSNRRQDKKKATINYAARPFMRPAWQVTVDKQLANFLSDPLLPQAFRDVFREAATGRY